MIKILVVSDSHGNIPRLRAIIEKESPFQYLIHCGDGVADLFHVPVPDDIIMVKVAGNIDRARGIDIERISMLDVGRIRIMAAHGDQFHVHTGFSLIEKEGRSRKADIVLFGHTHAAFRGEGKPMLMNPGPAEKGRYGIILLNGAFRARLCGPDD